MPARFPQLQSATAQIDENGLNAKRTKRKADETGRRYKAAKQKVKKHEGIQLIGTRQADKTSQIDETMQPEQAAHSQGRWICGQECEHAAPEEGKIEANESPLIKEKVPGGILNDLAPVDIFQNIPGQQTPGRKGPTVNEVLQGHHRHGDKEDSPDGNQAAKGRRRFKAHEHWIEILVLRSRPIARKSETE